MKHSTKLLMLILISTSFLFGYGAATGHEGLPLLLAQSPAKENPQPQKPGDAPTTDRREQYAYTLGVLAGAALLALLLFPTIAGAILQRHGVGAGRHEVGIR